MNKFLLILGIGALTCACSGSGNKEAASDSDSISDSIIQEMQIQSDIESAPDSLGDYYSKDLKAFGIKGNVGMRSVMRHDAQIVYPEPVMELEFDGDGKLMSSLEGRYAKQNDEGFNYEYSMNESDGTSWIMTYEEVNDMHFPVKARIEENGPAGEAVVDLTYSGYEYDSHGNWTLRNVSSKRVFTDADTQEKTESSRSWKEACSYTYRQ